MEREKGQKNKLGREREKRIWEYIGKGEIERSRERKNTTHCEEGDDERENKLGKERESGKR